MSREVTETDIWFWRVDSLKKSTKRAMADARDYKFMYQAAISEVERLSTALDSAICNIPSKFYDRLKLALKIVFGIDPTQEKQ